MKRDNMARWVVAPVENVSNGQSVIKGSDLDLSIIEVSLNVQSPQRGVGRHLNGPESCLKLDFQWLKSVYGATAALKTRVKSSMRMSRMAQRTHHELQ